MAYNEAEDVATAARKTYSDAGEGSTSGSSPGSDSDFGSASHAIPRASILDICLKDISSSIDRLATVTRTIRKASGQSKNAKAQTYEDWADSPDGPINRSAMFESFIGTFLEFQFRDVDERVRSRLQTAVSRCRRRIAYRRRHQEKLVYGKSSSWVESGLQDLSLSASQAVLTNATLSLASNACPADTPNQPNTTLMSTFERRSPLSQTTASALRYDFRPSDTKSSVVSGSSRSRLSGQVESDIPPPPPMKPGEKYFECPYCCLPLPKSKAKVRTWK